MELLHNIASDSALIYAIVAVILSGVGLFALRYLTHRTGIPTDDIQEQVKTIHEQAKSEVVEAIKIHIARDPKTGRFVSRKALPANKQQPDTPKTVPKEDEQKEEAEPAKSIKGTIGMMLIAFLVIPFTSCSVIDAGVKYATDNIEITWKGNEAKDLQPIDSIVIKFDPVYWKETAEGFIADENETEVEFVRDGYRVWKLRTMQAKRYEVLKLDTIIYIYKK